jgi:hypothetical protein
MEDFCETAFQCFLDRKGELEWKQDRDIIMLMDGEGFCWHWEDWFKGNVAFLLHK